MVFVSYWSMIWASASVFFLILLSCLLPLVTFLTPKSKYLAISLILLGFLFISHALKTHAAIILRRLSPRIMICFPTLLPVVCLESLTFLYKILAESTIIFGILFLAQIIEIYSNTWFRLLSLYIMEFHFCFLFSLLFLVPDIIVPC